MGLRGTCFCSAVPFCVSSLILHTQAESSAACSRDFCRFTRRRPHIYRQSLLGYSQISRFTLLHADGVHYQESVGTVACNILLSTMRYVKRKKIQRSDSNPVNISYLHAKRGRVMRASLVSRDVTMRQES